MSIYVRHKCYSLYLIAMYVSLFSGVVTAMDESVGRVVQALKQANMLENSIIVFMSDNGAQTVGLLNNYGSNYPLRGVI